MKKIVTLVLAIALLMTSVVAIAETKATPNINTFAKMTTKFIEGSATQAKRYEIKLSKPVTKLWVLWAEKGAEPEELAVDENLSATALAVEHKYMPGIKQSIGTSSKTIKTTEKEWTKKWVEVSEDKYLPVYKKVDKVTETPATSPVYFVNTVEKDVKWVVSVDEMNDDGSIKTYSIDLYDSKGKWMDGFTTKSLKEAAYIYEETHEGYTAEIKEPTKVVDGTKVIDKFGNKGENVIGYKDGSIQGVKTTTEVNKKLATNKATLGDRAFATLEGVTEDFPGWLVYRNRFGNFVAIEAYEGQL
jgi:hypothetical protein